MYNCTNYDTINRVFWEDIGVGMKKQKRYLFVGVILASMLLSGCGTQLFEMTKEEEELIVHSAAYFVAKHNIRQKDGVSAVVDPDTIMLEEESIVDDTQTSTEVDGESVAGQETAGVEGESDTSTSSMAMAVGHAQDLTVTYTGSYVADNYVEGDAYSIDAQNGKTYYIMQFTVTNPTEQVVHLDNVTLNPAFRLVDGDVNVKAEVTFLTTDFSTYLGDIAAGESVETVLLFEVTEAQAELITAPSLQITVDNENKVIKL